MDKQLKKKLILNVLNNLERRHMVLHFSQKFLKYLKKLYNKKDWVNQMRTTNIQNSIIYIKTPKEDKNDRILFIAHV